MTTSHTKSDEFLTDLRRAYRAEYARSTELQEEFVEAGDYAAFKIAENPEMIRKMRENYEAIETEAARQRAMKAGLLRMRH